MLEDRILSLAKLYADDPGSISHRPGGHNNIYLCGGERGFALRLTPLLHRSAAELRSEIDFMLYLKSNGVPLAAPLPGLDGEYVHIRRDKDGECLVSAFELAVGEGFMNRTETPERQFEAGKALGMIHRLSQSYRPAGIMPRRQWQENQHLQKAAEIFRGYDAGLARKFGDYMDRMAELPKSRNSFGLIHGDYFFANYLFEGDRITVYDFDDCEYSWYMSDVAIYMLYLLIGGSPALMHTRERDSADWFRWMMRGYLSENRVSAAELDSLELFFRMREYNLLSYNLEIRDRGFNEWQNELVKGILDRIMNDRPLVGIDYRSVFEELA